VPDEINHPPNLHPKRQRPVLVIRDRLLAFYPIMNPIHLPVAELKPALLGLGKVLRSRPTPPVLGQILIERSPDGWITLSATDLDHHLSVRLEHPDSGPALRQLVPYEQLQQLVKSSSREDHLQLGVDARGAVLRFPLAGRLGEAKVHAASVEEFPQLPEIESAAVSLPSQVKEAVLQALECASTDPTRAILNGVYLDTSQEGSHYVVATDGKHLFSSNSFRIPLEKSVLIPSHKFLGWKEFRSDGEWRLQANAEWVQLRSRRWTYTVRAQAVPYPNWRAVTGEASQERAVLNVDPAEASGLRQTVQLLPCHEDRYRTLGLQWQGNTLSLLVKAEADEPWMAVPVTGVTGRGADQTVFLNRDYLLKALDLGLITIGLRDEHSPLSFSYQGKRMIVMPVRDSSPAATKPRTEPEPTATTPIPPEPMAQEPTQPEPPTPKLDDVLESLVQLRESLTLGLQTLRDLATKVKVVQREQRANQRKYQNVRHTLRSLQGIRI